jgi:hypothetical protein
LRKGGNQNNSSILDLFHAPSAKIMMHSEENNTAKAWFMTLPMVIFAGVKENDDVSL